MHAIRTRIMGDYFKPWRKKIGVATLVIACVLAGGWVRSISDQDVVFIQRQRNAFVDNHVLISMQGAISWSRWSPIETDTPKPLEYRHSKNPGPSDDDWKGAEVHWHWQWNGFDFGASSVKETMWMGQVKPWTREVEVWQIPYWFLVVPLMLLSAYLLFSKPRNLPATRQ